MPYPNSIGSGTPVSPPVNDRAVSSSGRLEVAPPSQSISSFMLQTKSLLGQVVGQAREDIVSLMTIGWSFTLPQATNHGSKATKVHLRDPLVNVFFYSGNKDICMGLVATSRVCSVTTNICSYAHKEGAPLGRKVHHVLRHKGRAILLSHPSRLRSRAWPQSCSWS